MGIGFGALGTVAGITVGTAVAGALVISGPAAFVVVGLAAGVGGAVFYEKGKGLTEKLFEEMGW